jgi:hypothetical protein
MIISGEQLLFLVQVLKDSLDIQMGYDWNFKSNRDQRKKFHEELLKLLSSEQINVINNLKLGL